MQSSSNCFILESAGACCKKHLGRSSGDSIGTPCTENLQPCSLRIVHPELRNASHRPISNQTVVVSNEDLNSKDKHQSSGTASSSDNDSTISDCAWTRQ